MPSYSQEWTDNLCNWLAKTDGIISIDGKLIEVWELSCDKDNHNIMSAWATHFRNHYCPDEQIDRLRKGTKLSRSEYLLAIKFPDKIKAPGPSIRAGDFAEIVAADYLEFVLGYWVPRTRYNDKTIRNESTKGSDTIGFLFEFDDRFSANDTLAILESKAQFSGTKYSGTLQKAIDDSAKDVIRKAESLNAIKQRFIDKDDIDNELKIQRFQDELDVPYKQLYGAVSHIDNDLFDPILINTCSISNHPYSDDLLLIVVKGDNMMKLVHHLYERAANEA